MDELGERAQLLNDLDCTLEAAQQEQRAAEIRRSPCSTACLEAWLSQHGSRLHFHPVPPQPKEMLAWEKEMLGLYISNHPFQHAAPWLQTRVTATSARLGRRWTGRG